MCNISNSNPSDVKKGTFSNIKHDTKLEEAADTLEGRTVTQRDSKSGEMRQS